MGGGGGMAGGAIGIGGIRGISSIISYQCVNVCERNEKLESWNDGPDGI